MSLGIAVCPFQKPPVNLLWNKRRKRTLKVINLFNSPARASHATADNTVVSENRPRRGGMLLGCFTQADLWNIYITDKHTVAACHPEKLAVSLGLSPEEQFTRILLLSFWYSSKYQNQYDFNFRAAFIWCPVHYNGGLSGLGLPFCAL